MSTGCLKSARLICPLLYRYIHALHVQGFYTVFIFSFALIVPQTALYVLQPNALLIIQETLIMIPWQIRSVHIQPNRWDCSIHAVPLLNLSGTSAQFYRSRWFHGAAYASYSPCASFRDTVSRYSGCLGKLPLKSTVALRSETGSCLYLSPPEWPPRYAGQSRVFGKSPQWSAETSPWTLLPSGPASEGVFQVIDVVEDSVSVTYFFPEDWIISGIRSRTSLFYCICFIWIFLVNSERLLARLWRHNLRFFQWHLWTTSIPHFPYLFLV